MLIIFRAVPYLLSNLFPSLATTVVLARNLLMLMMMRITTISTMMMRLLKRMRMILVPYSGKMRRKRRSLPDLLLV